VRHDCCVQNGSWLTMAVKKMSQKQKNWRHGKRCNFFSRRDGAKVLTDFERQLKTLNKNPTAVAK
jgi:hypothetical protein